MYEYTYKFRIYPNDKQEKLLAKTFGCSRFVYNKFLEMFNNDGYISKIDKNNYCNRNLKQEYPWLKEVDKFSLTNSIYNLDNACIRFMNKLSGKPKFKNKHSVQSYQTNYTNNNIEVLDKYIKLPKLGKVKAKVHRKVEGTIIKACLKKYPTGKYYVMILVRKEIDEKEKSSYITAIDMGVKTFVTLSDMTSYKAPKALLKNMDKLTKEQRKLANKIIESNNYKKQSRKIAKLYEKCNNIREDFLHKLSTTIINENQVIIVEDLNVKEMFQKKMLSKVLGDVSISKFLNMLEYKAKYYKRQLIKINRYYPSSQLCSICGYRNRRIKDLSIRNWQCPKCHSKHDRDINAANNLLSKGLEYILV